MSRAPSEPAVAVQGAIKRPPTLADWVTSGQGAGRGGAGRKGAGRSV